MPFTIPNETVAAFGDQAKLFSSDIDALAGADAETGVVSGCAVTAQGSPDMTCAVAAGVVRFALTTVAVAAGNVTVTAAHGSLDRIDLVVVNNSGTKSVTAGTAAADPLMPAIPANSIMLAAVFVPGADTDIDANQIIDKRLMVPADDLGAYRMFMRATYR